MEGKDSRWNPLNANSGTQSKPLDLVRELGPWAATSIVVGTMIGTGIFIIPAEMARAAGSISLVFAAWLVGGALSLFGALAYAELSAALPEAGGEYAFLSRAYGPKCGFLFGWMHCIVGSPTSIATIAAGSARFCGFLFPAAAASIFAVKIRLPFAAAAYDFRLTWAQPVAVAAIAGITAINYLGVRLGGRFQVALTAIKVAVILAVIGIGFWPGRGAHIDFDFHRAAAAGGASAGTHSYFSGLLVALVASLWAYDGWNNLPLVGSEIIRPEKNIPRALIGGVAAVAVLYMAVTAACFHVLPFDRVAASAHVVSDVMTQLLGYGAAAWLTAAMIVCALGALNSSILTNARVDYAMARDGLFFRFVAGVNPKYRTPARALVFQGCFASILALSGTFEELYSLYIFAAWIFYVLAVGAVWMLRRKEPNLPRPYRTWGYPVLPVLFVLGSLLVIGDVLAAHPYRCLAGTALTLSGLLFYRHWEKARTDETVA
jgi:APA family basic amino acid/polyamine antiporter